MPIVVDCTFAFSLNLCSNSEVTSRQTPGDPQYSQWIRQALSKASGALQPFVEADPWRAFW